jgi:hypothetical protein
MENIKFSITEDSSIKLDLKLESGKTITITHIAEHEPLSISDLEDANAKLSTAIKALRSILK